MKSKLILLFCYFLCAGCISQAHIAEVAANVNNLNQGEHQRLVTALDSWVGHPGDEIIQKWGAPASTALLQTGGRVLTYVVNRTSYSYTFPHTNLGVQPILGFGKINNPSGLPSTFNQVGMVPVDNSTDGHWNFQALACRANLSLDKKDIIRSWTLDQGC